MKPFQNKRTVEQLAKEIEESIPALRAFAFGLCSDNSTGDDLVQTTCEKALKNAHQLTDTSGVRSWLYRILHNLWKDNLRTHQRQKASLYLLHADHNISGNNDFRTNELNHILRMDIRNALNQLNNDHRVAVVLTSMLGYGYHETAEILEISPGTVASRVARGRAILAKLLTTKEQKKPAQAKEIGNG